MSAEPVTVLKSLAGQPIPLKGVTLAGVAQGCLFELCVEQRYANVEAETIEAVYTFPLPLRAVLLSFELEIGERRLAGVVQKKLAAAEKYEEAVESGDSAALLEQARDGLYTVSLGNLKAGEQAVIRYRYGQLVDLEQGRIRLTIPTAVAPRYGDVWAAVEAHQTPSVDLTAHYPCTLALTLRGGLARAARVHSPTHPLVTTAEADEITLTTRSGFALDRDLVILIEGLQDPAQGVVARDGDGYVAVASVTAPALQTTGQAPKALKLVVDCSGSMGGDSIHQARDALLAILATLTPADRVSLTRFGSRYLHVTQGLEAVTPPLLVGLNQKVRAIDADLGGTEMGAALEAALALPVPAGIAVDVLLITDGEIWEIDRLVERLANARHRLFVIAVGSSPAEELARKVAGVARGACEFVTPGEDMRGAVARLLARAGAPVLSVGTVSWPGRPAWTAGEDQVVFPGDTVHVLAGFHSQPQGLVTVALAGDQALPGVSCTLPELVAREDVLPRIAAMRRLFGMEREAAAALAERYQLVTAYTSCVVVLERGEGEKAAGQPALRPVPHMLVAGWGAMSHFHGAAGPLVTRSFAGSPARGPAARARATLSLAGDDSFDIPPFPAPRHVGVDRNQLQDRQRAQLAGVAGRLAERLDLRKEPLPATMEDLRALGVSEAVLDLLRRIVADGYPEGEVVIAWLAIFAWTKDGAVLGQRLKTRLARAADRPLRERISSALAQRPVA